MGGAFPEVQKNVRQMLHGGTIHPDPSFLIIVKMFVLQIGHFTPVSMIFSGWDIGGNLISNICLIELMRGNWGILLLCVCLAELIRQDNCNRYPM